MSTSAETTKHAIDAVSVFTVIGTLNDILPPLAALFTIVWTGLRIYESETVQGIIHKNKDDE